jgi:S-adenosylmethionine uptake transporter
MTENMRGAVLMMAGMASFLASDALMKLLSGELPLFQAIFLRGIGVVAGFLVIARLMGVLRFDFPRRDWGRIGLRVLAEIGAAWFFLTALFNMPLANLSAILQVLPLTVTLAAALFLGERVGWRRMTAILVGFGGVLLMVQPGAAGFDAHVVHALAAVACFTLRDLATRGLSGGVPSVTVALISATAVTASAAAVSVTEVWVAPSALALVWLCGASVCIFCGYLFSVQAIRRGDLGFVAPFRYTSLLWALLLGILVFGERPDAATLTGAAIVVATGLYAFHRERKVARAAAAGAVAAPQG